jgi:hypothetical protein
MRNCVERRSEMRRNVKNLGRQHQAKDELNKKRTEESTSYWNR